MKVLLVEDEQKIADFVCSGLMARGMQVKHCDNGNAGYELAREGGYDVIVLDIMLPGRDGLSVLTGLREAGLPTPVMLLTALSEVSDRIKGLGLGADDYLGKPFFVGELAARINALVRRSGDERHNTVQVGELKLDRVARHLGRHGRTVELTSREFSLLEYLMRSAGQVFIRSQIPDHAAPTCLMAGKAASYWDTHPVGWALDGFAIFGYNNADGSIASRDAVCGGNTTAVVNAPTGYSYHVTDASLCAVVPAGHAESRSCQPGRQVSTAAPAAGDAVPGLRHDPDDRSDRWLPGAAVHLGEDLHHD